MIMSFAFVAQFLLDIQYIYFSFIFKISFFFLTVDQTVTISR